MDGNMKIADVQARVTVVRAWAVDHEEYANAHRAEEDLWRDVLQAIADGADKPADLARAPG